METINEISDRKKEQLQDDLKDFKNSEKKAFPADKKVLADAIKGTELALEGKPVPDQLQKAIFKAIELVKGEQ